LEATARSCVSLGEATFDVVKSERRIVEMNVETAMIVRPKMMMNEYKMLNGLPVVCLRTAGQILMKPDFEALSEDRIGTSLKRAPVVSRIIAESAAATTPTWTAIEVRRTAEQMVATLAAQPFVTMVVQNSGSLRSCDRSAPRQR
jgi:hypothetical protein